MKIEEVEITVKFQRVIEEDAEINEVGKDHLEHEVADISGDENISVPLHHHIEEELDIVPRDYNIGHYKLISKWE